MTEAATTRNILARLPHGEPFRFVSEVVAMEPARGTAVWVVCGREDFLRGHFPGEPIVPGVLLAEALAQLAGLVWIGGSGGAGAMRIRLAQVDVKFLASVRPPARVDLRATLSREMGDLALFAVEAAASQERAAVGTLVLARGAGEER